MSNPPPMPPMPTRPYSPPGGQPHGDYSSFDPGLADGDGFAASAFDDKSIRRKFISKVYAILSVQLTITFGVVCIFVFVSPVKDWVRANQWFYWLSYAVFLCTYIALACCEKVRRRFPGNFIALGIFTLAFTYMAGALSSYHDIISVLSCLGITVGVTFLVSMAAICCPCDITKCQALMLFLSVLLLVFGLVCTIVYFAVGYSHTLQTVYGGLAAIVFSLYLAYDTQLVIGGRRYELSPEEYIYGAMQLYVDIVNLFMIILGLFGSRD